MTTRTPRTRTAALLCATLVPAIALAQNLPMEQYYSPDGHQLLLGGQPSTGLYEKAVIRTLSLQCAQPNYWQLLEQNYQSQTDILATLTVDGTVYDSVGLRFKGQTSYFMLPANAEKMSFNVTMDHTDPDQDLMGYKTLNLNNAFEDASFLREVIYLDLIRDHVPAAKANYVHLDINGASWGIYPNVQQLNKDFISEWFQSNDGHRWRADRPDGQVGGGGGGQWGDGTAALNDLGPDTTDYQEYYTLKGTDLTANPWEALVRTCQKVDGLPQAQLFDSLPKYLDIDRTLWFLATEIAFGDDDSYVHKGKMDYYLYWEPLTGRMVPHEFDGNSVMKNNTLNWSPFYHASNVNFPLLNRLLSVPEWRQRYLAHLRTLITEKMQSATFDALVDSYVALIDAEVQADPKKLYSYNSFVTQVNALKTYIADRRNFLLANTEVAQPAPTITAVEHRVGGTPWQAPLATESPLVLATVTSGNGIFSVRLHHGTGYEGTFVRTEMFDDGLHDDGAAGDGVYAATLPPYGPNTVVRYYVEAMANNPDLTAVYAPPGAEHDVYTYTVQVETAVSSVVINELMSSNSSTVADNAGEYDDWIELYNGGATAVDLSDGFLTDDGMNLYKWRIPAGSIVQAGGYITFWADEDQDQGDGHTNFKLSGSGEELWLVNADSAVVDHVVFGAVPTDMGYARVPNGSGPFVVQAPTFAANNDLGAAVPEGDAITALAAWPNPTTGALTVRSSVPSDLELRDATGRLLWTGRINGTEEMDLTGWPAGGYVLRSSDTGAALRVMVLHH
ncbi:MAG: CotH kinase family protein [Flavobacteriales bacterium]|nr:hypothetical protein [Flavobacteriales bacterium]MCC6577860.1 CotH kinase family protein [Flavobacteriales bacterium]NUQ15933.1 CotH kinase family protein [Flavobacteriales bacterium]